jgi:hypothetical protein
MANLALKRRPYFKDKTQRHTLDTYLTPVGAVRLMVLYAIQDLTHSFRDTPFTEDNPMIIYDFGAGVGVFGMVAHDMLTERGIPHRIVGFEVNPAYPHQEGYDEWLTRDVLELDHQVFEKAHLVIGNPPFALAEEFVRKAIDMIVPKKGRVVVLISNDFEYSRHKRADFFKHHHYRDRLVFATRPAFYYGLTGSKDPDRKHYCVFVFDTVDRADQNRLNFDYDENDPVHMRLRKTRSMSVYALIYETARKGEGELCWDDIVSLLCARFYGSDFVDADDEERAKMWSKINKGLETKGFFKEGQWG